MSHDALPDSSGRPDLDASVSGERTLDVASHAPRRGMRTPLAGFTIVAAQGLKESLQPKRLIFTLLITLGLGAAVAFGAREESGRAFRGDLLLQIWEALDTQVLQILLPLIALIFAGPIYSREMRQRTMVYHLVRPVSRSTVFLARYVAGVVPAAVCATLLSLAVVVFADASVPAIAWTALPLTALLGTLVLGSIYCTLGAIFKRGVIAGLLYTFMMEVVVAGLPGNIQTMSVRFHLRSLYHGLVDGPFAEVSKDVAAKVGGTSSAGGSMMIVDAVPFDDPAGAVLALLGITVVILGLGVAHVRGRDFALKD